MRHHRMLAAALAPAALAGALFAAPAVAATPAAAFSNPAAGAVTVVPGGSFSVAWTESDGAGIVARTLATQTSAPLGPAGCDSRWLPVSAVAVIASPYAAPGLSLGRCYRFALVLDTASGRQTVTSAPILPATGFGPMATFTNPIRASLATYDTANAISWIESDSLGSPIVARTMVQEIVPATTDRCATVPWRTSWNGGVTSSTVSRSLARGWCYRFRVTLTDAAGYRATFQSGVLRVRGLPAWTGTVNLYRSSAFASQATGTWCVAASTQMMLNAVLAENDTSAGSQQTYIAYAQANDRGTYPAGSDPAGWAAALNRYGGGGYRVASYSSRTAAIQDAAKRMRITNKPVGLLVASGGHAWVMNGFTATADPATASSYTVTSVFIQGPLYPRPRNAYGLDPPPNTGYTPTQLGTFFTPYRDTQTTDWLGHYVLIVP